MTKDEALKLALKALIECNLAFDECKDYPLTHDAVLSSIAAIREALAQPPEERNFCPRCGKRAGKNDWDVHTCSLPEPEQEPFCYHDGRDIVGKEFADHSDVFPLYTAPPQRKPLTDDEIEDEWERITGHSIFGGDRSLGRAMYISPDEVTEFARAIEAAHGIKVDA